MGGTLLRQTVGEEIASRLRGQILRGELRPGNALREQTLAAEYDASRPSVRDALRVLEHEGLVQHETHRGARVAILEKAERRDVSLARLVLEPQAARRFDGRRETLAALRGLASRLEETAAEKDWAAYAEADLRFHNTIVASAGSRRLTELHLASMRLLRLEFTSVDVSRARAGIAARHVGEHRRITELLASGDLDEAARLLTSHLEDARDALA